MKLVGEIFFGASIPVVSMLPYEMSLREMSFCGVSDTSDTSTTADSFDASKTSPSVTLLSSYFERKKSFFLGKSFLRFFCRIGAVVRNFVFLCFKT